MHRLRFLRSSMPRRCSQSRIISKKPDSGGKEKPFRLFFCINIDFYKICDKITLEQLKEADFVAYIITGKCIECGKCEKECPKDAIYQTCGQYAIVPRRCIECGKCAKVCPVGAPVKKEKR